MKGWSNRRSSSLIINLKAAKQIGLTIPPEVLGSGEVEQVMKKTKLRARMNCILHEFIVQGDS